MTYELFQLKKKEKISIYKEYIGFPGNVKVV